MGKSSSLKKKRSKNSSQLRTRKRNKVKSRRSKSKKLRHQCNDSVSYLGDSDSRSMVSVSSSSSEDDYRSRRSRSRNRKAVKGGKKRARRQSSSRDSSEDSPHIKKCRGSRRVDTRKKTGKKKKSMRDVSVSSRSSGSWSCSTCRSDSNEIGYEKRRGRLERNEKDGRRLEKVKRGSKKSKDGRRLEKVKRGSKKPKDRSRSSSSCSRYNEGSDHPIEERVMEESSSRRLKSVITVVKQENESSRELNTDEPKEEVYDYDDYPSCRSNDSNDGSSRRELPQHSHVVSETKRHLDDELGEFSNIRTSSVEESGKDGKPSDDGVGKNDASREKNKVSSATGGLNGDDMESILRQRALENLRKFRGGLQKNINPPITQNDKNDGDVKTPSSVNSDPFQIKTPKGDDAIVVIASQVSQQIRQPPVRRYSTTLPKNGRNTSHLNDDGKYSGTVESDVAFPPAQLVPAGVPRVEVNTAINSVSNKSKLVMSQTRLEEPNTCTTQKQEAAAKEPSQAKLVTKSNVNEGGLETAQTVKSAKDNAASVSNRPKSVKSQIRQESPSTFQKQESAALESSQAKLVIESSVNEVSLGTSQTVNPSECGNNDGKVNDNHDPPINKPSSFSISTSGDISSGKLDETKDSSQFQQKTMSVMRGGEMVQVNYQVYIPKRAPALARRQLKR